MKDFIKKFYFGELDPQKTVHGGISEGIVCAERLSHYEKLISEKLATDSELLREYEKTWEELLSCSACESFVKGFRMGAGFVFDVTSAEN